MSGLISFIKKVCVQTAVYWDSPTPDGYGGYTYANPIEIKCRWDSVLEQIRTEKNTAIMSKARILVTQEVKNGGYLYLGDLASLSQEHKDNPITTPEAYPIQRIDENPLFRSTDKFVRTVWL